MIVIRDAQLRTLAQGQVDAFRDELIALMQERCGAICEILGVRRVETLVDGCIAECRGSGATSRSEITLAALSLFQASELPELDDNAVGLRIRAELQTRQLMSMMETLSGLQTE